MTARLLPSAGRGERMGESITAQRGHLRSVQASFCWRGSSAAAALVLAPPEGARANWGSFRQLWRVPQGTCQTLQGKNTHTNTHFFKIIFLPHLSSPTPRPKNNPINVADHGQPALKCSWRAACLKTSNIMRKLLDGRRKFPKEYRWSGFPHLPKTH